MINDAVTYSAIYEEIAARLAEDRAILDQLRDDIRPLKDQTQRIYARNTTSISLVGTDGGNNQLRFDPFLIQVVRVVDSSANEYCLRVVTPTTDIEDLSAMELEERTALGELMLYLGVHSLSEMVRWINPQTKRQAGGMRWTEAYRELAEWAVLFRVLRNKDFGTDTLIVFDGLLRSLVFAGDLFARYLRGLNEGIAAQAHKGRRIYLVGVAKKSKVLSRYALAMALEEVLTTNYPAFVQIGREIEEKVYAWSAYARSEDNPDETGAGERYAGGKMFFVKFGDRPRDPVWPVDVFLPQVPEAQKIMGCLLADAINGFPIPLYPQCLQQAHEHAALVDFDFDVLQDQIFEALRRELRGEETVLDVFRLRDAAVADERYERR